MDDSWPAHAISALARENAAREATTEALRLEILQLEALQEGFPAHSEASECKRRIHFGLRRLHLQNAALRKAIGEACKACEESCNLSRKRSQESQAKSSFLARISHDLRTPMNAISGMSELALREYGEPAGRDYLNDIQSACADLLAIVNDLLDISRIESGKLEILDADYDLSALLGDALRIVRIHLMDKPLEFSVALSPDLPSALTGDRVRIQQILQNLLSNAIKYTPKGFVRLEVSARKLDAHAVQLSFAVSDSGLGIRAEDQPRLFEEFARFDTALSKQPGTGLGLPIARSLARALGGDILVKSAYGEGSTFTATVVQSCRDFSSRACLPLHAEGQSRRLPPPFLAPAARVLAVDDDRLNLKLATGLLAPYGMQVDTARNGLEAIEMAKRNNYDLIFMDHMMPGLDGVEATRAIRALRYSTGDERFTRVPVVSLTANALAGMREMFLENGFNDFLSKPIELPKLQQVLAKWLPKGKILPAGDAANAPDGRRQGCPGLAA
jgi:signal transduction histidine kinase/ActR/RegA family two-component response regulator